MENKFYILFEIFKESVKTEIIKSTMKKQVILSVDKEEFKQKLIKYHNNTIMGYFDINKYKYE